ncbi:NAD(P)-dependent dehydrogenase, short-chain alcohol dehydrogenase family [Parasphingorhabdus marina DSM 22363]|uniref:NAD(P)-dependent dehydrogenase, short-chain alcohol dehydrogenase family n=1 Tax=Parasphingorhabdus marina DSM 22363 TaxID=1123272 RepID=A0A1N6H6X4_9SPHN|nr:SDR family NAD(P)-dependent oxidoreductase [Parasphingorhabdus marina]SIO15519.1 NAD(P)-dependent dehydrogenase, short-chain alcohol dehydrogenase family [Parasphingorhabdus marina DSM 22363]
MTTPNFSIDLTGSTAIVTGASAGLGKRFAEVLAASGAKVACTARRKDKLDDLVEQIRANGGEAQAFALDVRDAEQLKAIVPEVTTALGQPDILVNNAGIVDAEHATRMSLELIDNVLDTNLRSVFILSNEFARPLIEQKQPGRIVNIASIAASHYGGNGAALYSITKAGVARVTETLSVEWSKFHINVNGIAPGLFATDMADGMIERSGDFSVHFPRKRIARPDQLDSTLLFLVSPSSDAVTGTVVKVDDGQGPR